MCKDAEIVIVPHSHCGFHDEARDGLAVAVVCVYASQSGGGGDSACVCGVDESYSCFFYQINERLFIKLLGGVAGGVTDRFPITGCPMV